MTQKIVFIIAFRDFKDEEYFIPRSICYEHKYEIKTASWQKGIAVGVDGGEAIVDLTLEEVDMNNFDAVVFVGGNGASKYFNDELAHHIASEAVRLGRVLAAICIAPIILAKAGVLKDKKATGWYSNMDKTLIQIFKENGVKFIDEGLVIDGKIITADGPTQAKNFAIAIDNSIRIDNMK